MNNTLATALDGLVDQINHVKRILDAKTKQVNEITNEKNALETQVNELEATIKTQVDGGVHEQFKTQCDREIASLKEKLSVHNTKQDGLKEELQKLRNENNRLKKDQEKLKEVIASISGTLSGFLKQVVGSVEEKPKEASKHVQVKAEKPKEASKPVQVKAEPEENPLPPLPRALPRPNVVSREKPEPKPFPPLPKAPPRPQVEKPKELVGGFYIPRLSDYKRKY